MPGQLHDCNFTQFYTNSDWTSTDPTLLHPYFPDTLMMEKDEDDADDYKPISVNDFIKAKIKAELEKKATGTIGYLSF